MAVTRRRYVSHISAVVYSDEQLPNVSDLEAHYAASGVVANMNIPPDTSGYSTRKRFKFEEAAGKIIYGRFYYTEYFWKAAFERIHPTRRASRQHSCDRCSRRIQQPRLIVRGQ